jgi:hypothetical protein
LVEHATENRSVGGSIPPLGTILSNKTRMMDNSSSWLIQEISIRGTILGNKTGVLKLHAVFSLKLATDRNSRPSCWGRWIVALAAENELPFVRWIVERCDQ